MKYFLVITALLICFTIKAEEKQIASPDGKIVVTISDKNGQPSYRISYKDTPFINSSSLGLITNIGDFYPEMYLEQIPAEKRAALIQILEQDPRPSYQKDPVRIYGMSYAGMEIHFRVDKKTLYVTEVERS